MTIDPMDFARLAAELEGDATVGAGTSRPTYMKRIAAAAASAENDSIPTSRGEPSATATAASLRTQLEKEAP